MDQSIVRAPSTSNQRRPPPRRPLCGTRLDPTLLELVEILNSNNADKLLQEDDIYERFPFEIIDADTPKLEDKEDFLFKSPRHFSKDNMVRRTLANGLAFWKMNDKLGCIANEAAVPLGEVRHFTLFYGDKSEGIKSDWRMVEITSVGGDGKSSIAILKDCNSKVKECCLELHKAKKKLLAEATSLALAMLTKNKAANKNKPKAKKKNKAKDDQAGVDDEFKESRQEVAELTKKVRAAEKNLQEAKNDARERDWSNVETVKAKRKTNKGGEEQSVDMDGSDEEADIGHYMREYTSNVVLTDKVETEQGNMISDPILIEATRLFGDVDNELHSSQSTNNDAKSRVTIVILGHADSGKSTLAGHLLYKVGAVGKSVIESYEKDAALMNKGSLKYAWVMDKSIAERERGITIDIGEGNFETQHYNFTVLDAPGQHDYIETMIRGTLQADTAVLVLDSTTGSFESGLCVVGQTREHALLAYTLGVKRMICCCNKMDGTTPKYSKGRYCEMVKKMSDCLIKTGYKLEELLFIPVSGFDGDNLIEKSTNLDWYNGPTLLEALQQINSPVELVRKPLRVPLLNIHEIEGIGTMAVGSVEAGVIQEGMLLRFAPTGSTAKVNSLVMKGKKVFEAIPGDMVAFSCSQVSVNDLTRGYVASDAEEDPARRAIRFTSQVLVLNHPGKIKNGYTAVVECHASKVSVVFEKLLGKKDRGSGSYLEKEPQYLMNGDVGLVIMVPAQPMVVETFTEFPTLGHFVVWDMGQIVAVGVVKSVDKECPD